MRESNYWFRIVDATITFEGKQKEELVYLLNESTGLMKILGSIVVRSKANR